MHTHRLACLIVSLMLAIGDAESLASDPLPKTPQQSLRCLRARGGLRVELVAAEPLVVDPIAIAWGFDGRLWVVEMGDYPLGADRASGRVRFLTDTDGDGRYDKSTVFLDGLSFPTGIMPWRDGVLVTCAPEIFYAEDTDRDGRADKRETLYRGFNAGNPQHTVNGPRWGLDNWVHVANGDLGGVVESIKTGDRIDIFGHDLRIRPASGAIELETGMSQFGRCRDDWGNWFGGNSASPLWHCAIEDRYLLRNTRWSPPNPAVALTKTNPPVSPISRPQPRLNEFGRRNQITSACGPCVYRDDHVAPRGSVFVCEPAQNLVHQRLLSANGSTFTSRPHDSRVEFLASTDNWFRPTQVRTGPDGALWVVDMYRSVIEHPEFFEQVPRGDRKEENERAPDAPVQQRLRSGSDRGRIYRVYHAQRSPRRALSLASADAGELAAAIDSPNGPRRDLAHQLLVQRRAVEAAPILKRLFRGAAPADRRLQALCALDGLGRVDDALLLAALIDTHAAVRRHAARIAESHLDQQCVRNALLKLVDDPDPQVRLQLACSLGEWRDPLAGAALTKMLVRDANDLYIAAAVMSAGETHVQWILPGLMRLGDSRMKHLRLVKELLPATLAAEEESVLADTLNALMKRGGRSGRRWQWEVLSRLLHELDHQGSSLLDLESSAGAKLSAAIRTLSPLFDEARQVASDKESETADRVLAVRLLGRGLDGREADIRRLRDLLTRSTPVEARLAAVNSLANTRLPDVARWLLRDLRRRGPRLRAEILDTLLRRKQWTIELLDALESRQLAQVDLGAAQRNRLILHPDARIRDRAAELLDKPTKGRGKVVADYLPSIELVGDRPRGEKLFNKHCAACHRPNERGERLGPDLREMSGRPPELLLIDILDPNRRVDPRFLSYTAETRAGRIYQGIVAREAGSSLRVIGADGKHHDLLHRDVRELVSSGKSLMPEGMERLLPARQDLADLIAFLRSRRP